MRRLYSTFAGGWPGTGLLLIRFVVGSSLLFRAIPLLRGDLPVSTTVTWAVLGGSGILIVAGLWTPIAGTLVAAIEVGQMLAFPADAWASLFLGTMAGALAMLGPGLWSIDARLFGWKRVEAPPRTTVSRSV